MIGPHIQLLLKKAGGVLDQIKYICPLHGPVWRKDLGWFIEKYDTWSSYSHPYVFTVRSNKGKLIKTLEDNKKLLEKTRKYNWGKRETFSFTTSEGVKLDGWMVKPVDFDPAPCGQARCARKRQNRRGRHAYRAS